MDDGPSSAFVYALFAAGVVATVVAGTATAHPGVEHHDEHENLSKNESARLWSLDEDSGFLNATEYEGDRSVEQILLNGTDFTWLEPPQAPLVWNRDDIDDFPAGQTDAEYRWLPEEAADTAEETVPKLGQSVKDRSVAPSHAEFTDGNRGWIKDAHATTFAIQPSTRLQREPGEPVHYIDPDGELIGTVDYRVSVPPDNRFGNRRALWSLINTEIEATCVVQGGDPRREDICSEDTFVIGSSSGSRTPTISYDATGRAGNQQNISLAAEIEVALEKKIQVYRTPDDAPNFWETIRVDKLSNEITVADRQEVTLYGLPRATAQTRRLPEDDKMGVSFSSQLPYASVGFPSGAKLYSQYEFYTARDPRWDTLTIRDASGSETVKSGSHPIQTFAIPSANGTTIRPNRLENEIVAEVTPSSRATPNGTLDSALNVGVIGTEYTVVQTAVTETATYNPSGINVTGFVHGDIRNNSEIRIRTTGPITEAHLTTTRLEFNSSHTLFRVTATDPRGDPIRTAGTDAAVTVKGERYNTNTSGQAVILIRNVGSPKVRYEPADWWATHEPHSANVSQIDTKSSVSTPDGLTNLFIRVVVGATVPLSALWFASKIPGVNTWPPREVL